MTIQPSIFNIKRLWQAILYSLQGVRAAVKGEVAFRQELFLSLFILPSAIYFGTTNVERSLLIGAWLLVLIVELLNSSIETVVDRIGIEHNSLSGKAKDLGSAAVLLAIGNAIIIWLVVLF